MTSFRQRILFRLAGTVLGALLVPGLAQAHPHGWIDLRMRVVFDAQGHVVALQQAWLMDPFYSLVVREELEAMKKGTSMAQRLDHLGTEIRDNLADQHYFTELSYAGRPVALGEVADYTTRLADERLEFSFVLPLAEPLALSEAVAGNEALRYKVYDPTYYIEVVHMAENAVPSPQALALTGAAPECRTTIIPADPDPAKVMQAAMLDVNDTGEAGLGRFFAETGEVVCGN